MTLVPVGDNVVIRRVKTQTMEKGIYLPESVQNRPNEGKVLAVGDGRLLPNGTRSRMSVNDGDRVLFTPYQCYEINVDGEDYLIISEHDILAIIG